MQAQTLEERASQFASEVQATLDGTLSGSRQVVAVASANRYVVRPEPAKMKLFVDGAPLADLSFSLDQELDSSGLHLKTTGSKVTLWSSIDRTPLVRLEYRSDMRKDPISHWQVHAERGSMSHILGRANHAAPDRVKKPHDYSSLHFPVGGERFRPCLEDVIQFLIVDCGFDAVPGWLETVQSGRESWRRLQLRSSVRDAPEDAADVLTNLGWTVIPPASAAHRSRPEPLRQW